MGDFLLDLRSKLIGGALEFVECFAHLTRDLRQLLRPKNDQGQKEEEDRLGKTHAPSYCPSQKSGNWQATMSRRSFADACRWLATSFAVVEIGESHCYAATFPPSLALNRSEGVEHVQPSPGIFAA